MRITTIGDRMAHHLRHPSLREAGLRHVYRPAPARITEGPAAVIFAGSGNAQPWSEQIWHHEVRLQLMQPALGLPAAELNVLESLIEPIWDHFAPGTQANQLIIAGAPGAATHCDPVRYEGSQVIEYPVGTFLAAITIVFDVKVHRFAGAV